MTLRHSVYLCIDIIILVVGRRGPLGHLHDDLFSRFSSYVYRIVYHHRDRESSGFFLK